MSIPTVTGLGTNYVLDTDLSNHGCPAGSIGVTPSGEEAFTCREEGCGAMPGMPCYFAMAEQYTAHWNTKVSPVW